MAFQLVLFLAACFNFSFSLVFVWSCHFSFISFSHVRTLFSLVKFQSTKSLSILVYLVRIIHDYFRLVLVDENWWHFSLVLVDENWWHLV